MKNKIIKSAIALSIVASAAFAQTPAPIPMGSWLGFPPAGVVPAGSLGSTWFFSQHKMTNTGALSNETQKQTIAVATFRTGFNNGWGARIHFPLPIIKNQTTGETLNKKIGNTNLYLEKDIFNQRAGDSMTLSFDIGAGIPSAQANNGWGFRTALRGSYRAGPHIVHGGLFYNTWQRGSNKYKEGDSYQATAVYTYAINHTFDVFGGFDYAKQKNHKDGASGIGDLLRGASDVMYANIGFGVKTKVATVSFGVGLPVVDNHKGVTLPNGTYRAGNEEAKSKVKYGMFVILPLIKPKQN